MRIKIISNALTKREIKKCLELLGDEYADLDIVIEVHTVNSLKDERKRKPELGKIEYNNIFAKGSRVKGCYEPNVRKVKLFPFNFPETEFNQMNHGDLVYKDYVKYAVIFNLFHEIRHAWQHKFNEMDFLEDDDMDPIEDLESYKNSAMEIDADSFERKNTFKYTKEIREILQIKSNYVIDYQPFK